jgi:hypothetical protein
VNICRRADVRRGEATFRARGLRGVAMLVMLAFSLLIIVPVGWAKEEKQDTASEAGLGAASVILSIPYGAAKIAYAILGGITGGFTYALTGGNLKAAEAVWDTALRGTYIITPDHLRGEKPIRFLGVPPDKEDAQVGEGATPAPGAPSASSEMIPSGPPPTVQSGPAAGEITR